MTIWYREKNCKVGLTNWYQCDKEDFINLLNHENDDATSSIYWLEVKCVSGHWKVLRNYEKNTWWFKKM